MKSPFTGGAAVLKKESRVLEFRKDSFEVSYHYYVCVDSGEQFTTTDIDTLNITQVHNKYREKYGIPFTDEIKNIREKYGLSAFKMSEVLGLGVNVYRNYEAGEMPSVATGRLIRLAQDATEFAKLVEMSRNALEPHEYARVKKKLDQNRDGGMRPEESWSDLLFGSGFPTIHNGFRVPSLAKVSAMVHFFAKHNRPFTTALNKLMFYADFGHYKKYGQGISGIYYKAIQRGPVPENYGALYSHVVNNHGAWVEEVDFGDYVGERFVADDAMSRQPDEELFTTTELDMLARVSDRFKGLSTKEIVDISHEEPAWQQNINERNRISFDYGFELKNVE